MLLELRGSIALRQSGGAATARAPEKSAQELSIAKPRELPKHEVYALLESIAYKMVDAVDSVYRMNFAPVRD